MKTSIATVSIAGDLGEKLDAVAAAGFDGVEIFENDFLAYDKSPREVGQMVRDKGLEISLFQPFRDFEAMPEPLRHRTFERAERKFDLMGELGADLVLICSNVSPLCLGGIDRAAADFHELGERAAKRGIRIGYEALAWGRFINDHRDAWEVVRRADHANVGLILDSFHTLSRGIELESIRAIPGDRIFCVQLADAPKYNMDLLFWSRHYRNMPGQGDLDVLGFTSAVAATGYEGVWSLEIFNDQFRSGSTKAIAIDGHRSLVNLMDQVARTEPALAKPEPSLPAVVGLLGVEFVEFAANTEEAAELARLLRTLGFRRVGRHVSKAVDLWRQGAVNILINTEPNSFAHSSYLVHGTNVCDLGLRVSNAAATVRRSRALGATAFEQPVGPGELHIPAIRGVGGGVVHFIDEQSELRNLWEVDFKPVADDAAPAADAGLAATDHVAQTMEDGDLLTWLLFYTSIFDMQKTPVQDVADPGGLIKSQTLENGRTSFRIVLNASDSRRTLAGQFVAESAGSGVQHLAFATHDLLSTARALERNGFEALEVSPNYYDDLEARLGLEPDLLETLRHHRILYDRDDNGGEFLQLYSKTYGERFFFEIVERRGGYRGMGAINTPFRLAAQAREARHRRMAELI